MDFAKIQKLVLQHGDKFVIVQDGEPAVVVMSFGDYEKLAGLPWSDRSDGAKSAPPAAAREEGVLAPHSRPEEWQIADAPETEFIPPLRENSVVLPRGSHEDDPYRRVFDPAERTGFIDDDPPAGPLARPRLDEIRLEDLPL